MKFEFKITSAIQKELLPTPHHRIQQHYLNPALNTLLRKAYPYSISEEKIKVLQIRATRLVVIEELEETELYFNLTFECAGEGNERKEFHVSFSEEEEWKSLTLPGSIVSSAYKDRYFFPLPDDSCFELDIYGPNENYFVTTVNFEGETLEQAEDVRKLIATALRLKIEEVVLQK